MDTLEYVLAVAKRVEQSLRDDPAKPWHERIKEAGDAVMEEEE